MTWEVLDALSKNEAQRKEFEIAARDEFFQSIVNEVHEEINLAPADQSAPLLLGVVLQTAAWTPSFCTLNRVLSQCVGVSSLIITPDVLCSLLHSNSPLSRQAP